MPQFTFCPQCNTRYDTAGMAAGKRLRCRNCKAIFSVQDDSAGAPTIGLPATDNAVEETVVPAPGGQHRSQTAETGATPAIAALTDASGEEKYAVEDEIARGGMGLILKALDRDIRRPVAMKVMLDEADENKRARFVEEAQVTGQLEHPNIMPIHELGLDAQGRLFFTMKLVQGRSLEEVLKGLKKHDAAAEREYSLGRLLTAFVSVCNAMALAHAKGVVHRDLKPANIMLGDYGEVLVMDWGLAKPGAARSAGVSPASVAGGTPAVREARDTELGNIVQSLRAETGGSQTVDGTLMGTPHYMPPEQAEGNIEEIDARSDIYSLGAILYELLTLQTPCAGETTLVLLANVSQGKIQPPHERAPERNIPPELAAVAMKALARRKEDRYQRVEDLRRDVELFLEGRAVSAKEDSMWEAIVKLVKRNQAASVTAGVAAALLLVVGGVSYWVNYEARTRAEEQRARAEASERQARQALADLQAEQLQRRQAEAARRAEQKKSVPAFLGAARTALTQMKYDDALAYLRAALDFDPENAEALLLESQLLICLQDYAGAVTELGKYLALRPDDADARKLAELAAKATPGDLTFAPAFAEVFSHQKAHYFAANLSQDTNKLLAAYKQRLDEA